MKIISRIRGGIGNQLFQYFAGETLASRLGVEHFLETSSFIGYSYHHSFELANVIKDLKFINSHELVGIDGVFSLKEGGAVCPTSILVAPRNCLALIFDGYWQNEKFFESSLLTSFFDQLEEYALRLLTQDQLKLYFENPFISVHIRRRDYQHMGICKEEYYIGALLALVKVMPACRIFVFSDEPNYAVHFLSDRFTSRIFPISTGDDFLDLYIMARSSAMVISNSTFSWWGARLQESKKAIIVAPLPWCSLDTSVMPVPERWLTVPFATARPTVESALVEQYYEFVQKTISGFPKD